MKKQNLLRGILLLGATFALSCLTAQANLLSSANPGFEDGNFSDWEYVGAPTVTITSSQSAEGTYSAYVSNRSGAWESVGKPLLSNISEGKFYRYSIKCLLGTSTPQDVKLQMKIVTSGVTTWNLFTVVECNNTEWTELVAYFSYDDLSGVTNMRMQHPCDDVSTTMYFDDAKLEEIAPHTVSNDFSTGVVSVGEFSKDLSQWDTPNMNSVVYSGGALTATSTSNDPQMRRLDFSDEITIETADYDTMKIRCRVDSNVVGNAVVYFGTTNAQGFSGSRRVTITTTKDGNYHTYTVDMSSVSGWSGTLDDIRFDPFGGSDVGKSVSLDFIRFERTRGDAAAIVYLPPYRMDITPLTHLEPATHIIYHGHAFSPTTPGLLLESKEDGTWPLTSGYKDKLDLIRDSYPETKLLIGILGNDGYAIFTDDYEQRQTAIDDLVTYCLNNDFDGADFDWEFPDDGQDGPEQDQYTAFLIEAAEALHDAGLEVGMATGPWGFHVHEAAYNMMDTVQHMGYDGSAGKDAHHSSYSDMIEDLNTILYDFGIDRERLAFGVPFYAKEFLLAGRTGTTYRFLQENYGPLDEDADTYDDGTDLWTFNGVETIKAKTQYAVENGFLGVMVWEIGQDTWTVADQSLLLKGIQPALDALAGEEKWTVLAAEYFEDGMGLFSLGGNDAYHRYPAPALSHHMDGCAEIRDDSGTSSAITLTTGLDLHTPGYTELKVDFWFLPNSMENGEDFFLEYYDGVTWHSVDQYVAGTDFQNGDFHHVSGFVIPEISYAFPANAKIRLRCDASGNGDNIYLDEIVITAR